MAKAKRKPKDSKPRPVFEENLIQDIRTTKKGETQTQIRIVEWIVDGRPTPHKLEKRQSYTTKAGKTITGRNVGFTKDEMNYIISNWDEIELVFK